MQRIEEVYVLTDDEKRILCRALWALLDSLKKDNQPGPDSNPWYSQGYALELSLRASEKQTLQAIVKELER